ncbi:MAG: acyl transferase [Ferruginibacter sp.]|nr:acyl transferase [Ferruginibacter sp.]
MGLPQKIFTANDENFISLALEVFRFQYDYNRVYRQYCNLLKIDPITIKRLQEIPFLPIGFFKTHQVVTTEFDAAMVFESSGTTQTINSKHYVKDTRLYEKSFIDAFRLFYDDPADWCILALLPSYLERNNSSLVMMADQLIQQSGHPQSGFYLNEWEKLPTIVRQLERMGQKTLLIGVSFALLDFAERFPMRLQHTTIMETGGMKGRREEMTRQQLHEILCSSFGLKLIHSEYGMTELLSQAYSAGNGIFNCPPWMKVLLREEDDPFAIHIADTTNMMSGAVNIIDLANIYSCSFIATEDAGKLYPGGSFELLGRLDNTDIRGCSLLAL